MKNVGIILAACALLLTVAIFLPYSLHPSDALPNSLDPVFYAWNLSHNARHAFGGMSARTDTNIFYPLTDTIAYSDTLWAQSLVTSPIIWISQNPILAENIAILLTFPLAAVSMYMLALYFTKNSLSSFMAGLFYAFSYPRLSQIGHLPTISNQWLPLYILYLFKFLDDGKHKNLVLLFIWFMLSLTSSIYFAVFLIPITVVIILIDGIRKIQRHTISTYKNRLMTLLLWIIPFTIILGVAVFPYLRLKAENPEIHRSISDLTYLRAEPNDYVSILPTSIMSFLPFPKHVNEHVLYPTFAVFLLAIVGSIWAYRKNKFAVIQFVSVALVSFVLSPGNQRSFTIFGYDTGILKLPYYYLYTYVPIFQIVRVPARLGIFVVLSLSILAAFGIKRIIRIPKYANILIGVIGLLFLLEIWQTNTPYVSVPLAENFPKVYTWVRTQPEPVIIAEVPIALFYDANSMESQLYKPFKNLRQSDMYALEAYRSYFSTLHNETMINGYSGYWPDSYNKIAKTLENFPSDGAIHALQDIGVTHVIVHVWEYDGIKKTDMIKQTELSPLLTKVYSDNNDMVFTVKKKN